MSNTVARSAPASEDQFLELVEKHFPQDTTHVVLGRGDDCAVVNCPEQLAVSTDLFLEDVHFRRSYFSARDIGHKALAVNISDLAGMGCTPLGFSMALMTPAKDNAPDGLFWDDFFAGMAELAQRHGLALTGGDLSRAPMLGVSITVWGKPAPGGNVLERGKCRQGDTLVLLGTPGLARTGLMALEAIGPKAAAIYPQATEAHLRPEPLVAQGQALATLDGVRGAMDLSDGLARDLPRLLGPDLGADLRLSPDVLHPELEAYCEATGDDPTAFAVLGGEDYGLLVATAPQAAEQALRCGSGLVIGTVTNSPGILLNDTTFSPEGFDHFTR